MGNLRVQEYIARSGRYHIFKPSFDNIRSALISMRSKANIARYSYRTYYDDYVNDPDTGLQIPVNKHVDHAHLETDNETYIDVISDGGAKRRFTIVTKRGGEPVPFGHLLKQKSVV